ncbi:cytochrome c biogenesis CcdA family protein [Lysobacter sp.]|uniref:cytochrome c biogenesis CcdA family protein n=1 Tax=Lysobacter sp. TaxID=72226 RepID=UPI002D29A78A|nr:cytochrome c biogenesis CcdA family protein [Lysobacter sp.]HZX76188.1 cytochrome c biogenesis CcdA family protein [Lysobacter sp.]
MIEYPLAALAGIATVLSPCILPVLPIVLATSAGRTKLEPLLVIAGFVMTFAAGGIALGALAASSGELQNGIRNGSIVLLLLAGLACLWPAPFDRLVGAVRSWRGASTRPSRVPTSGALGALLIGASLGIAWTPCAGPVLASMLALAASSEAPAKATTLLGLYAVGAGIPLIAIAYGGDWVSSRLGFFNRRANLFRKTFGAIAIGVALLQLFHYDAALNAWATQWLPTISTGL